MIYDVDDEQVAFAMSFLGTVVRAKTYLHEHGHVSLRALQREFEIDDEALADLVEELVDVQQVASREGKVLSWIGATRAEAFAPEPKTRATPEASSELPAAGQPAEAERRQLHVMFCDLVDSTGLSQRLDAEDLREVVRAYQESASAAIELYEGHIAQYLGDGILAYFGYPRAHEDDAERAGREILAGLEGLNGRLERERGIRLAARVGIHTGPVVVGEMGGGEKRETLALGETTNIAARLESVAPPDSLVISDATLRLVPGMFATKDLGTPALKGITEPIRACLVLQATGVRSRLATSVGRLTSFIGRQPELGVLIDTWERLRDGTGQAVLVQGEAGLGKSRLCYELRERLSEEPHTWLECGCSPFTTATAFRPIIALVEQALDFRAGESPTEKLAKLAEGLRIGDFADDEAVLLIAEWLGLPESAGYTPLMVDGELKRSKTIQTLVEWFFKVAELQPVVALTEDLHWCDPSSLELLGRLVAESSTARVLLLATARTEFDHTWATRSNFQTLKLDHLTTPEARELIAAVITTRELPDSVVEQLVDRAGGVPLYAEELTQSVLEARSEGSEAVIPVTLQDSLMARLDRLSSVKEVAQRVSVLGREFSYSLLAATAGLDEVTLQRGLERLVVAELLFVRGVPPEATYTFRHALLQEAAYESLLKRTRQQLHGRVVDALATDFPERAAAEPQLVAHHAEAAGRLDAAVAAYQQAGEQAQARSAYEETTRLFRRALAILARQPEDRKRDIKEAALQQRLGASIAATRGVTDPEVEAAYERSRVLCEAAGDMLPLGWALAGLSSYSYSIGSVEHARELAERVLAIAGETSDVDLELRGHVDVATAELYQGKFASSLAHYEAAHSLYEPERSYLLDSGFSLQNPDVISLGVSSWDLWMLGWPDRALARVQEAVALARRIGHRYSLAASLVQESVIRHMRRDLAEQRERAAEAMAVSEERVYPFWFGVAATIHTAARVVDGEPEAAADLLRGLAVSGGTGNRGGAPGLMYVLGDSFLRAGQLAPARDATDGAIVLSAQTGQSFYDAELNRLRGEITLAEGGVPADAEALFLRARDTARAQEAMSFDLRAATSLARLWQRQGMRDDARDLLQPVYDWFTEGFDTQDLKDAKALLEELT